MQGKNIKQLLQNHGLSEAEIARKMGLSPQNLNSKLKGKDIGLDFIKKIALASKIPLIEFIPEVLEGMTVSEPGDDYGNSTIQKLQAELKEAKEIIYQLNMELLKLKMSK